VTVPPPEAHVRRRFDSGLDVAVSDRLTGVVAFKLATVLVSLPACTHVPAAFLLNGTAR